MKILLTGATGMLGQHLKPLLWREHTVWSYGREGGDLTSYTACISLLSGSPKFDAVIHLGGVNGGLGFKSCFDIFQATTSMAVNMLRACVETGVERFLAPIASCAYGDGNNCGGYGELLSHHLFSGTPEPNVAAHAYAKRNLQLACKFAREQYGVNAVTVCPPTLYGEGDRYGEREKVMAAMVRRFSEASRRGDESVTCWGSGTPLREFMYAGDCAELICRALDSWDNSDRPLNLTADQEYSVAELATLVASVCGYTGEIKWDASKPDGQMRKKLCGDEMREVLGDYEFLPIADGIKRSVIDYRRRFLN